MRGFGNPLFAATAAAPQGVSWSRCPAEAEVSLARRLRQPGAGLTLERGRPA